MILHSLSLLGLAAFSAAVGVDEWPVEIPHQLPQRTEMSQTEMSQRAQQTEHNSEGDECNLRKFRQWREEIGYWIGDLTFYGPDGAPFESNSWNYRYDLYRGFITGNVKGRAYRQRNVFLYPPQTTEKCAINNSTTGVGACGVNGNSKLFEADQSGRKNGPCDGTIGGPYAGILRTKTTLVGKKNALLYQVSFEGKLFQSQLTTLSGNARRTRSAHGYNPFGPTPEVPTYCSFYRERRVDEEEFYSTLNATLEEYGILEGDACTRDSNGNLVEGVVGGLDACRDHLDESFQKMESV